MSREKIKAAKMVKETAITYELFSSQIKYDPETGHFYRRADVDDMWHGYMKISFTVDRKRFFVRAHRAAFLYMTGKWPEKEVDHKDRNKANNKWINLREASHSDNLYNVGMRPNNTSGFKGVSYHKGMRKWVSYVTHNGKRIHLGSFKTKEEAAQASEKENLRLRKDFHTNS